MAHPFIEHLKKDHEKQRELGQKLRMANHFDEFNQAWKDYYIALYPHLIGEEDSIFLFLLEKSESARVRAVEALQEHYVDRILMSEINELDLDEETFHAKAYVLEKVNRMHIYEEEIVHFPLLERLALKAEMDELFKIKYLNREEEGKEDARRNLRKFPTSDKYQ
jgi:hemerythrin superfamily protein